MTAKHEDSGTDDLQNKYYLGGGEKQLLSKLIDFYCIKEKSFVEVEKGLLAHLCSLVYVRTTGFEFEVHSYSYFDTSFVSARFHFPLA